MIEVKTLKSIASSIKTGKTPPSKESKYFDGDVNWYTPGDLDKEKVLGKSIRTLTPLALEDKKAIIHKAGTLLVGCIGDIGKIGVAEFECSSNQQITGIYPNSDTDVNYLYYWFRGNKKVLESYSNNAVVPILNNKTLETVKIPLPPLEQQKKIAAILDAADAYRQKTKALITKYDELTQSLFLDMFGDPVTNPKGWEVLKLKDLATKIRSGNTPKGGSKVYVDEGIQFFRSQNVWKNRIELDDIAFIDNATHKGMTSSSLKHRDILMTKTGRINTENSSLGRAAMYLGEDDQANLNGHVYLIRPKKEANNEFILFILTTIQFRDLIRRVCVGGIDKRQLNKEHIEDFPIINPPKELIGKFTNNLNTIYEQKKALQINLEKSEELFNSLLQRAFKGELTNA